MPKVKKKLPDKEATKQNASQKRIKTVEKRAKGKARERVKPVFDKEAWKPKTEFGKKVKSGEIKDIDVILNKGRKILEAEIIEVLIPDIKTELLLVGQSKGKFGGGARRVFRQTQKKTREGNKPRFATIAIAGNENGYVGIGYGKSKETVPAREKALRNAKMNIMKIKRACGSWECGCGEPHTIPYKTKGKCGSAKIILMPAPKGTGLSIEKECAKILKMAGITDVWSKMTGKTGSKLNLIYACLDALQNIIKTKVRAEDVERLGIIEGAIKGKELAKENKEFLEKIKEPEKEAKKEEKAEPKKE